jgi:radical SAM superfamily enzyme YgiQ (UPF0313 family)
MRILLVKPRWANLSGREQVRYAENVKFPALGLGILAALSEGHEVRIADGGWEPIPYGERFDLVGITVTTFASQEVYEIASRFRASGARVVLGGVHACIMTEECLRHADAVVVGEAEYLWPQVLRDAERGELAPVYRATRPTEMRHVPLPRRELLGEASWFTAVEASRGCPNRCSYCYLPHVPWHAHRTRPVELVLEEVRTLPQKAFIFVDENLFADREYALRLFRGLSQLKKFWIAQAPTDIAGDEELLDAMAEAGCFNVQVGFQSFNRSVLDAATVSHNRVERYRNFVDQLHARRIVVSGFFIFGFDQDGPDVFEHTVEAIRRLDVDDANLFVLTPFPGTKLHAHFEKEGRLLPERARRHFGWSHAVFQPAQMSPEVLEAGVQQAYDQLHPHFRRKLPGVLWSQLDRLLTNPRFAWGIVQGNFRRPRVGRQAQS